MKIKIGELATLRELPKGSLFLHGETIGLKTEYSDNNGRIDAYIVGSGEFFWGGTDNPEDQSAVQVVSLKIKGR